MSLFCPGSVHRRRAAGLPALGDDAQVQLLPGESQLGQARTDQAEWGETDIRQTRGFLPATGIAWAEGQRGPRGRPYITYRYAQADNI